MVHCPPGGRAKKLLNLASATASWDGMHPTPGKSAWSLLGDTRMLYAVKTPAWAKDWMKGVSA